MVSHERRAAGRKCAGPLVGGDIRRVRVEDFVVGVKHLDLVPVLAEERDVRLVAEINDLLIRAVPDEDGDALGIVVGDEIDRALHGVEIPGAVAGDHEPRRIRGRRALLVEKVQPLFPLKPVKLPSARVSTPGIDLHVICLVVLQKIVVRVDGRHVVVDDHGVKVEGIGEAADDGQLVGGGASRPRRLTAFPARCWRW